MVPFVINILVLSIFEWPLKTGFTVLDIRSEIFISDMCIFRALRSDAKSRGDNFLQ